MNQTVWKTILDSLNWEFREACTDHWQNIRKEKELAWTSIVYIFFPEMMQSFQNNDCETLMLCLFWSGNKLATENQRAKIIYVTEWQKKRNKYVWIHLWICRVWIRENFFDQWLINKKLPRLSTAERETAQDVQWTSALRRPERSVDLERSSPAGLDLTKKDIHRMSFLLKESARRDSNPRPRPWQGRAPPTEPLAHKC